MNNNSKWKNYGLYISLAATGLLVLQTTGVEIDVGKYNAIVEYVLAIFVALGVISNPSLGAGYIDKK